MCGTAQTDAPYSPFHDTQVLPPPQNNVIIYDVLGSYCSWRGLKCWLFLCYSGQKLNLIPGPVAQSQSVPWNRHFSKRFLDDPWGQSYLTPRKCLFVAQPVDHEIRLSGLADTPACRHDDLVSLCLSHTHTHTHTHTHRVIGLIKTKNSSPWLCGSVSLFALSVPPKTSQFPVGPFDCDCSRCLMDEA